MARVKRGEEVYERIRGRILDSTYAQNSRLPSEPRLCEEFGVSRPVIREALARLRVEGLILSRQGAGTFVRAASMSGEDRLAPVRNLSDIRQCFDFRVALEGEAAFHAAQNRDDSDLAAIREAFDAFANARGRGEPSDDLDFAFHVAIAEATHIYFFASVIASMRPHIMVGMELAEELSGIGSTERMRHVLAEHEEIFEAIREMRANDARLAMRCHIDASRHRLFEGEAPGPKKKLKESVGTETSPTQR